EVAGRGGAAAAELTAVGKRVAELAELAKTPEFIESLGEAAKMDQEVAKATALLGEAKAEGSKAVEGGLKAAKGAEISAQELEKLRWWTSFDLKYAAMTQKVNQTLPASLEAFHQAIREAEQRAAKDGTKTPDPGTPDGGGGSSKQPAPPQVPPG